MPGEGGRAAPGLWLCETLQRQGSHQGDPAPGQRGSVVQRVELGCGALGAPSHASHLGIGSHSQWH